MTIPAGEIWEAVAEVGNMTTLYVNGRRVDDASVILPRPVYRGGDMYQSKRVPLKEHLKTGRNVLGLYVMRAGTAPAAYLRGAVIMGSGDRILLDSGTNWVWSRAAPENWAAGEDDAAGWLPVMQSDKLPNYYDIIKSGERNAFVTPVSGISLNYRSPGDMPCYDGFIKLRHPADAKLFFDANQPIRLEAAIPPGFRDGRPELAWEISRYAADGTFTPVADGRIEKFRLADGSLVGEVSDVSPAAGGIPTVAARDAGGSEPDRAQSARLQNTAGISLARGIYVFTSRLQVNGQTIEERDPEPLLVTGKVPMPESAGDALEQGMELGLEKIVDFTDPQDPHPWYETDVRGPVPSGLDWGSNYYHTVEPALIVERGGLKYRTTRKVYDHRKTAQFSYKVDFAHPGDWYLMVLEYPDDGERWIGVSCNAASHMTKPGQADGSSKCGPIVWTGGKYPNTGKMLEMKWIYRPDPGSHAINVMSLMKDADAAAARLRIYHIAGRLPELAAGTLPVDKQRRFGMLTERTCPYQSGIYNLFSSFAKLPGGARSNMGAGQGSQNAVHEACERLRVMEDAASHYAEYMRFAGQNLHTMGCHQYNDRNTAPQYLTGDSRLHYNPYDVLARVLQANDLLFYASVEFLNTFRRSEGAQDPAWYLGGRSGRGGLNFMHPEIEQDMLAIARQLAEEFKAQPNFLGINWTAFFGGGWLPSYRASSADPLAYGYDDFTINLFEQETGIKAPGSGDQSSVTSDQSSVTRDQGVYEQRYQFLTSDKMKPAWLAWRAQKMYQFFAKVQGEIRAVRPDLETVAACYLMADHVAEWKHQQIPFRDYLNDWGWDPEIYKDQPGLWLMPWLHANARYRPAARTMEYAMGWQGNHDPEYYRPFAGFDRRALMLTINWHEVERIAANFPYQPGWPRPYQQTMMGQQREEFAMEPYTQALIGFDPQMVMMGFTDVSPYIGVEGMQRKFARVLRRLPWGRFEPVLGTGFDSNLAIRGLPAEDGYYFYVANPGYWPIKGTVTLEGAAQVGGLVSGKTLPMKNGAIDVELEPFGLAAFRALAGSSADQRLPITGQSLLPKITAWTTAPVSEKELAHIRSILDQAKAAIARPDVAGFLGSADYGMLTGTVATAEQALDEQRYARAWDLVTDAFFWTILFQKVPEMQFADILKPRTMNSVRLGSGFAPKIDGVLNDRVWEEAHAKPVDYFVTKEKTYSPLKTFVRLARTKDRLFIAFECHDPAPGKIRGTAGLDDEKRIWEAADDLAAIFIAPDTTNYYQFAVSASGAKFDQRCRTDGWRDYDYAPQWQAAVQTNREGWVVEIEIDLADAFAQRIVAGAEWKINFHRCFRLNQQPYSSWVYSPNWHSLEHMGTVRFVEMNR